MPRSSVAMTRRARVAAACAAGAASTTQDQEEVERMRLFGEKIGISFQIRDDLFDLNGHAEPRNWR